ncbi:MAG: hypothetical protein CMH56_09780 [Myxococcales bacterium]|nr:hypothetical protein [Myxococcales bacterium]|tara:strand:- start:6761 stop:7567 length:807 start_codon:yes stop_codon:yes gene_type:complete
MKLLLPILFSLFVLNAHSQESPSTAEKPFAPLEGTFALKIVTTGKIDLPLVGEKTPKGHILFLLTRKWNNEKGYYSRKARICSGTSGSMFGISTKVSQRGYRSIPPSYSKLMVDEKHETLTIKNELFLWGLKNLPKPLTAKLPQSLEEAQSPAFRDIVYDVDKDGHPGITIKAEGMIDGELHAVQRRVTHFNGKAFSPDRQAGRVNVLRESVILESTTYLIGEGPRTPMQHPDPKRSWFEAIRINNNDSCDTVLKMNRQNAFSKTSPL